MDELEQEHFHEHEHTHDHEHAHPHEHDHADGHKHPHHHENTKYVQNRLARASGHLQHVRAMVDSGEDCSDVLMQLSAVIGALQSIAKVILKDHLDHCVHNAVVEMVFQNHLGDGLQRADHSGKLHQNV